jgi:hypothetical protein
MLKNAAGIGWPSLGLGSECAFVALFTQNQVAGTENLQDPDGFQSCLNQGKPFSSQIRGLQSLFFHPAFFLPAVSLLLLCRLL